ncbi:MAG: hypothetical protein ACOYT4_00375 [Nanoarchaeota archaeon]
MLEFAKDYKQFRKEVSLENKKFFRNWYNLALEGFNGQKFEEHTREYLSRIAPKYEKIIDSCKSNAKEIYDVLLI